MKIRFRYVKKIKNRIRENEKVAVKFLEKIINVPFFTDVFQLCQFFSFSAIFILMIENSVREFKNPYVKKYDFLCVKT